jgi:hypothetical protein
MDVREVGKFLVIILYKWTKNMDAVRKYSLSYQF